MTRTLVAATLLALAACIRTTEEVDTSFVDPGPVDLPGLDALEPTETGILVSDASPILPLASDDAFLYYLGTDAQTQKQGFYRVGFDGGAVRRLVLDVGNGVTQLALHGVDLVWTDGVDVYRAPKGGGPKVVLVAGVSFARNFVSSGEDLYFSGKIGIDVGTFVLPKGGPARLVAAYDSPFFVEGDHLLYLSGAANVILSKLALTAGAQPEVLWQGGGVGPGNLSHRSDDHLYFTGLSDNAQAGLFRLKTQGGGLETLLPATEPAPEAFVVDADGVVFTSSTTSDGVTTQQLRRVAFTGGETSVVATIENLATQSFLVVGEYAYFGYFVEGSHQLARVGRILDP